MKLSTAIRMGSLLIENPQAGNVKACAITMANLATGFEILPNQLNNDHYSQLTQTWPWIITAHAQCPCGSDKHILDGTELIWGPFDHHVMWPVHQSGLFGGYSMTIEQLADFIASIEPEEECQQPSQSLAKDVPSTESVEVSS
jgi:hypothetical protein